MKHNWKLISGDPDMKDCDYVCQKCGAHSQYGVEPRNSALVQKLDNRWHVERTDAVFAYSQLKTCDEAIVDQVMES
jgi:hypothetical protein